MLFNNQQDNTNNLFNGYLTFLYNIESVGFAISKYLGNYLVQLPYSLKRKLLPREFGQTDRVHKAYEKLDKNWNPNPLFSLHFAIFIRGFEMPKKIIQNVF